MNNFLTVKPDPNHYQALDGWRGVCAVMVALFHFRAFSHIGDWAIIQSGGLFLDFFFVLSGFVIFANYYERLKAGYSLGNFMLLRFGRLYPLHFAMFFVFIFGDLMQLFIPFLNKGATYPPFQGPDEGPIYIIANLTLLHSFGITERLSFNAPSWSISAEFYTYLIYALVLIAFHGNKLVIIFTSAAMLVFMCLYPEYMKTTADLGVLRCIFGFGCGAITWFTFERFKDKYKASSSYIFSALEVSVFIFAFLYMQIILAYLDTDAIFITFSPIVFAATVFLFAFQKGIVSKILRCRFFSLLGILSYSIYMTHILISGKVFYGFGHLAEKGFGIKLFIQNGGVDTLGTSLWMGDAFYVLYIVTVIAASYITYCLIEVPGRNWARNIVQKRRESYKARNV